MDLAELAELAPQQPATSPAERPADVPFPVIDGSVARRRGRHAANSSNSGVGKFYGACIVCGLLKQEMPPNSLYCWDHKRAVDSLTTQCKATDKKNKNTECMDALNKIREEGKLGPPSTFSDAIIEFEASAPSQGRGIKRKTIDSMQLLERYITRTSVRNEAKLVRMHEEQWLNHAKTVMLLSHQEAEARWLKAKETTPEKLADNEGPGKSLRLPMHVEDAIYMGSSVDFERIAEGSSKRKKLTGDDQLAGEALKMQTDHVGFKDDMFSKVGGAAAPQIACNGSDVVTSACLGSFGEVASPAPSKSGGRQHGSPGASTSESVSPLPAALAQGSSTPSPNGPNSNQKPTKATKTWDVATQRLKLQNEMQEKCEAIQARANKMLEACFTAAEKTLPRCFGQNSVRNQINYLIIMQNKVDVLQFIRQARHTDFQRVVLSHAIASDIATSIEAAKEFLDVMDKLQQSGAGVGEACWTDANHQLCLAVAKVAPCLTKYHDHPECNIFSFLGWDIEAKHFKHALSAELQKTLQDEIKATSSCWSSAQDALQSKPMLLGKCVEACAVVLKAALGAEERASAVQTLSSLLTACLKHDATTMLQHEQIMGVLLKHGWVSENGLPGNSGNPAIVEIRSKLMDLWGANAARVVAEAVVAHRQSLTKPLPVSDMSQVPLTWELQTLQDRAMTIASEDDDKVVRTMFKNFLEAFDKVVKNVGMSQNEVLNNVANFDRRAAAEQARAKKQLAAEQTKREKKAQAEAKKRAKQDAPAIAISNTACSRSHPLMDMTHDCILPWPKFAGPDAVAAANADQFNNGCPFVVTEHSCVNGLVEERGSKAVIGIFRIQFPASEQAKKDGRGQVPFNSLSASKVREAMLAVAPPGHLVQAKDKDNVAAKAMEAVSLAGCAPGTSYQGLEKQSFATIRYNISGRREVLAINYMDMCKFAAEVGIANKLEKCESHEVHVKALVDALACQQGLDTFKKLGLVMHRVVINPGETFFIPMCSWLLERTIGDESVIGLRTACLLSTQKPRDSLQLFVDNYKKVHGEDGVVNFWGKVLGLLKPSPAAK